jgi:hypothetical protein
LRIGSSRPVYVAGLLRREPRVAPWSTTTTPSRPATEPWISERMNELLLQLRDKGNTVLVVEHKPEAIAIADHVVDLTGGQCRSRYAAPCAGSPRRCDARCSHPVRPVNGLEQTREALNTRSCHYVTAPTLTCGNECDSASDSRSDLSLNRL